LKLHAYQYLPVETPKKGYHCLPNLEVEYSEALQKPMPIFSGPDQDKPWVRSLHRLVYGH